MDYLSLCLICKDENDYLPEWLDYHALMGVDRFYIYDNESSASLKESLKDYINRGWVVVVDIPGRAQQLAAYDHCLQVFGSNTFWMGFIDTDEFLVPKSSVGLKDALKEFENYGGVAVSSLFFGSNGHVIRPAEGQISAYTTCVHESFNEYDLVKSIVQPACVLLPNSPHDFIFKEGFFCVNENHMRVDGQHFPVSVKKIQLNHYYCRSEEEIQRKLKRGRGALDAAWPRRRFDVINQLAEKSERSILEKLEEHFHRAQGSLAEPVMAHVLENMSILAKRISTASLEARNWAQVFAPREEFEKNKLLRDQIQSSMDHGDLKSASRLMMQRLDRYPQLITLYADLANCMLDLGDFQAAWQVLSAAWKISPNHYVLLNGMAFYFLRIKNYKMAENTSRLVLNIAPHDMIGLGMLTHSLIGQDRFDEALEIGIPVVEIAARFGELPGRMGVFLVKKMADHLVEKKDFLTAVRLWESGVLCQPQDAGALFELSQVLFLAGKFDAAINHLKRAEILEPNNQNVKTLIMQIETASGKHE